MLKLQEEDLFVSWFITPVCNFHCRYCSAGKPDTVSALSFRKFHNALKETGKKCIIGITGGEPFLYPDFVGVCRELTKDFNITINTNLSLDKKIEYFADTIDPDKVRLIYASSHVLERKNSDAIKQFIKNVALFKKNRFKIKVNYVLYPSLLKRFEEDYKYFMSEGIELLPKPFRGWYRGKRRINCSNAEKDLISRYNPGMKFYPRCFKGIKCNAGKAFIRINEKGMVTRCLSDSSPRGDINSGIRLASSAEPCRVNKCSCFGYDLIEQGSAKDIKNNFSMLHEILASVSSCASDKDYLSKTIRAILASFKYGPY